MHNAALNWLAQNVDKKFSAWRYSKFEIKVEELAEALPLFYEKNFRGLNFTVPHKLEVAKLISCADGEVEKIGACNTLEQSNLGWSGHNTDGYGLEMALQTEFAHGLSNADIILIGAGGAARAAAFYAYLSGAKSVSIFNRSVDRLDELCADLKKYGYAPQAHQLNSALPKNLPENSIIINAAAVGIKDGDPAVADFFQTPPSCVFFDMAYRRGVETNSVRAARACGLKAASGLAMLAWQGAKSLAYWANAQDRLQDLGKIMLDTLKSAK